MTLISEFHSSNRGEREGGGRQRKSKREGKRGRAGGSEREGGRQRERKREGEKRRRGGREREGERGRQRWRERVEDRGREGGGVNPLFSNSNSMEL